jgi:hypothetical protein
MDGEITTSRGRKFLSNIFPKRFQFRESQSLGARVLWSKNISPMRSPGNSPSDIWRSIIDGTEVLKKELIWRIGDGKSMEIWNMNWIPRDKLKFHFFL